VRTLVLGIGNSILGDDGVGVSIARELDTKIRNDNIDVLDVNIDGLNLLEVIVGYDKLIVIDAIMTEEGDIGEIYRFKPEMICDPSRSAISPHHFNLVTTIEIGKKLFPNEMPEETIVYAVKVNDVTSVTEKMTKEVEEAIPEVVRLILEELHLGGTREFSDRDSILPSTA
jgi:hydrogenase maturation protease